MPPSARMGRMQVRVMAPHLRKGGEDINRAMVTNWLAA